MDFEDIFSNNNSQYSQNQGCDNPFNDFLSLQSPISMPSVDPSNLDTPSSYIGTANYIPTSNATQKPLESPTFSSKNRTSEFTNSNYDFSYNFMNSPIFQPQSKSKSIKNELLQNQVPTPQITLGTIPHPYPSEKATEPPLNLTLNDIMNNFTLMQQQRKQQKTFPAQQIQQKQLFPFKKKLQPVSSKKTFKPFVSIESCEFTVDRLRSFIETHKRRSLNHF